MDLEQAQAELENWQAMKAEFVMMVEMIDANIASLQAVIADLEGE